MIIDIESNLVSRVLHKRVQRDVCHIDAYEDSQHYKNTSIKIYLEFYHQKKKIKSFQMTNSGMFHISAQKHRLWVLVRTASARRF